MTLVSFSPAPSTTWVPGLRDSTLITRFVPQLLSPIESSQRSVSTLMSFKDVPKIGILLKDDRRKTLDTAYCSLPCLGIIVRLAQSFLLVIQWSGTILI